MRKCYIGSLVVALLTLSATVFAQPAADGTRTILIPRDSGQSNPMNVVYHPGFDQYYASTGGSTSYPASVYDNTGTLIHTVTPSNIDVRSWNHNPDTGALEVVTFNAVTGGGAYGLIEAAVDGAGLLTGGTAVLLGSMPGNLGSQTMPAYDHANARFFSRDTDENVNLVSRVDGSLEGTLVLDFASAGVNAADITQHSIGFVPGDGWLVVTDHVNDTAVVFDTNGNYLGTTVLDIDVQSRFRMSFTNGQLFAFDGVQDGWQGIDIGASGLPPDVDVVPPMPATPVPTLSQWALIMLSMLLGLMVFSNRKRLF
jgi:hypothetical protein